ncbi:MAG TPA: 16S rRNA (guanine(966)-N(2))-methyltransferase RsmD [Rudaea sp.]|nr:16S rRNA (guanine(966)-N(2))-methyltransferase RsmD [Rudaea sp.]
MVVKAERGHGRIRIIGGSLRGSRLNIVDAPGLRPTPDRVRETLFNWLMPVIEGATCLDLFAGSGALGIEALSRGAARVDFVESDRRVAVQLRENLARLHQDATVECADAIGFLSSPRAQYDIVFVDPPFAQKLWESVARELETSGQLAPHAWIYIESPAATTMQLPANWVLHRHTRAGAVDSMLYRRARPSVKL